MAVTEGVVHIATPPIQVGPLLRQRCGWCGALLLDYDLAGLASPCDERCQAGGCAPENHYPATWAGGDLVEVDGACSSVVPHIDGDELPAHACAQLDAEVTA